MKDEKAKCEHAPTEKRNDVPPDLIIYALVAAGLIFWLRSILGTKHGEERQRPNPLVINIKEIKAEGEKSLFSEGEPKDSTHEKIIELAKNPTETLSIADEAAQEGLIQISTVSKDFDIKTFLEAAQDAFVITVESFAEGDKEILEDLLDTPVYKAFKASIEEREEAGNIQKTQIHAITQARVLEAKLEKNAAHVTVRFEADQTSILEDKKGKNINGNSNETTKMIDIWTFTRDIKSNDPRWLVTETRGDFEDDNDLLPNA